MTHPRDTAWIRIMLMAVADNLKQTRSKEEKKKERKNWCKCNSVHVLTLWPEREECVKAVSELWRPPEEKKRKGTEKVEEDREQWSAGWRLEPEAGCDELFQGSPLAWAVLSLRAGREAWGSCSSARCDGRQLSQAGRWILQLAWGICQISVKFQKIITRRLWMDYRRHG